MSTSKEASFLWWEAHGSTPIAKIEIFQKEDGSVYPSNVTQVINEMREKYYDPLTGKVNLDQIIVHVKLPAPEERHVADELLQQLCASDFYWKTLEVIMPDMPLFKRLEDDSAYADDMSQNKDGVCGRVSERFCGTCLVFKGHEQNVPWPWLDVTEMSRFQISSLRLKGGIPLSLFQTLVKKANMDGTANALEVHVDGVVMDDTTSNVGVTEGAVTSRIQSLRLGYVKRPITLESLLLAGQVHKSIVKLQVTVMGTTDPMDVGNALKRCEKLESAEIVCGLNQRFGFKTACEEKQLDFDDSATASEGYFIAIAWKKEV
ncbi:hypothetical protein GGG16DRAFT_119482 [Schizophyllum commune]